MSFFIRILALLIALFLGAAIALFVVPTSWVAPRVQHATQSAVRLEAPEGTLARGGGLLVVPELGLRTPVRWQIPQGLGAAVEIGGGSAIVNRNGAHTLSPIALGLDHAYGRATLAIAPGATLVRTPTAISASGQLSAPQVFVNVPTSATFSNLKINLKPDGAWTLTAEGDAKIEGSGSVPTLSPLKGNAQIDITPAASNPALDALIRRNIPADGNGRHRLTRAF
jgi:hypothetical protein